MRTLPAILCGVVAAPLLAACAASTEPIERQLLDINEPGPGVMGVAQPGDAVVERSKYRLGDGLISSGDIIWTVGLARIEFKIPPGALPAVRRNNQYTYYVGVAQNDFLAVDFTTKSQFIRQEVRIKNAAPPMVDSDSFEGDPFVRIVSSPSMRRAILKNYEETGYEKRLTYQGRTSDLLQFEYREISGDRSQPDVTQRFQHDLKDGRIIGYSGARIELLDLNDEQMTYRVLSSFPEKTLQ